MRAVGFDREHARANGVPVPSARARPACSRLPTRITSIAPIGSPAQERGHDVVGGPRSRDSL